jgi:hypothetical protein
MADADKPINLLLITCDQWRGDCLGCAGHPVLKTPALDALAAEGVRFDRHFGQAAPCSPGLRPANSRHEGPWGFHSLDPLAPSLRTLWVISR